MSGVLFSFVLFCGFVLAAIATSRIVESTTLSFARKGLLLILAWVLPFVGPLYVIGSTAKETSYGSTEKRSDLS